MMTHPPLPEFNLAILVSEVLRGTRFFRYQSCEQYAIVCPVPSSLADWRSEDAYVLAAGDCELVEMAQGLDLDEFKVLYSDVLL